MLSHLGTYQWLILDKICIVTCHKLILWNDLHGKKIHQDSIFCNLCHFFGFNLLSQIYLLYYIFSQKNQTFGFNMPQNSLKLFLNH